MKVKEQDRFPLLLLVLFGAILLWSAIGPKSYWLWALEVAPAVIGAGLCLFFYVRQPFTRMTYFWCFVGAAIMAVGAHYSYSEVPLFNQIRELLNGERNNFDKLGHFVQGIIPVLIAQEVFIRRRMLPSLGWVNFLSICVALTVAASYELIEWMAVTLGPDVTDNFLGMQGYFWDAQSDMFYALLGACCTLLFSKRMQRIILKEASA